MHLSNLKSFLIFALLLASFITTGASAKELILESGAMISLEPDRKAPFIYVTIFLDKASIVGTNRDLFYAEYFLYSLSKTLEKIPCRIHYQEPGHVPEFPYNWLEQGFIILKCKKEFFNRSFPDILEILSKKPAWNYHDSWNFSFEKYAFECDSSIWLSYKKFNPDSLFIEFRAPSERRYNQFYEKKLPMNRLYAHFYGSFDLVDIYPYLNHNDADLIKNDRPQIYFSEPLNTQKQVVARCGNDVIIRIKRNPLTKTEVIAEHFLADYFKLFLKQRFPMVQIKFYAPWSFTDSYLSIRLFNAGDLNIKNDLIGPMREKLLTLPDSLLKSWYYDRYTTYTTYLHADVEKRLILRHLSGAYLNSRNLFFNVIPEYAFPVKTVKKNLIRLIDDNE